MKKSFLFSLLILAIFSCSGHQKEKPLDFEVGSDKFAIVVMLNEEQSFENVHKEAVKKSAKVALDKGYKYFKILSQKEISLYQKPDGQLKDLIAKTAPDKNFLVEEKLYPAYRITIRCFKKRPFWSGSIEANKLSRFLSRLDAKSTDKGR